MKIKRIIALMITMACLITSIPVSAQELNENQLNTTNSIDFSSCSIIVSDDANILDTHTITSQFEDLYVLSFASIDETKQAYEYYKQSASICDINTKLSINDDSMKINIEDNSNEEITEETTEELADDNSIEKSQIEENSAEETPIETTDEINKKEKSIPESILNIENNIDCNGSIAVIDTGINKEKNVIERVSVIGESIDDDNGHGTTMYNNIVSKNPGAKILSIKALDNKGVGFISDVYRAIRFAIDKNVSIINLSMNAYKTDEAECINQIIQEAYDKGIYVVVSAGNDNRNTKYYIPACNQQAFVIGSCTHKKEKASFSNYGDSVDCYLESNSTSEAAAKFSGLLSKNIEEGSIGQFLETLQTEKYIIKNTTDSEENKTESEPNIENNDSDLEDLKNTENLEDIIKNDPLTDEYIQDILETNYIKYSKAQLENWYKNTQPHMIGYVLKNKSLAEKSYMISQIDELSYETYIPEDNKNNEYDYIFNEKGYAPYWQYLEGMVTNNFTTCMKTAASGVGYYQIISPYGGSCTLQIVVYGTDGFNTTNQGYFTFGYAFVYNDICDAFSAASGNYSAMDSGTHYNIICIQMNFHSNNFICTSFGSNEVYNRVDVSRMDAYAYTTTGARENGPSAYPRDDGWFTPTLQTNLRNVGMDKNNVCNATCSQLLSAEHHYPGHTPIKQYTSCVNHGVATNCCSCSRGNYDYIYEYAWGHASASANNGYAATCTANGKYSDQICARCGVTLSYGDAIPALGHSWNEGAIIKAATCTEKGMKTYTCTRDNTHTYTEEIPALGHNWKSLDGKTYSDTNTGIYECTKCKVQKRSSAGLDINSIINGTTYGNGKDGFTFNVEITDPYDSSNNTKYNATNYTDYCHHVEANELKYGMQYKIIPNTVKGYTAVQKEYTGTLTNASEDTQINPKWNANTYTIVYHGNNATNGTTNQSSHTYDVSKNLTKNGYSRTGFTFVGWNTKADGSGTSYKDEQSVLNLTNVNNGKIILYAQWKLIPITISVPKTIILDSKGKASFKVYSPDIQTGTLNIETASFVLKQDGKAEIVATASTGNEKITVDKKSVTINVSAPNISAGTWKGTMMVTLNFHL